MCLTSDIFTGAISGELPVRRGGAASQHGADAPAAPRAAQHGGPATPFHRGGLTALLCHGQHLQPRAPASLGSGSGGFRAGTCCHHQRVFQMRCSQTKTSLHIFQTQADLWHKEEAMHSVAGPKCPSASLQSDCLRTHPSKHRAADTGHTNPQPLGDRRIVFSYPKTPSRGLCRCPVARSSQRQLGRSRLGTRRRAVPRTGAVMPPYPLSHSQSIPRGRSAGQRAALEAETCLFDAGTQPTRPAFLHLDKA